MKLVGDMYFPDSEGHFTKLGEEIGEYQRPQREKAFEYVSDWRLCIDVGANVGIFSRHFASRFEQVLAIEPVEENVKCLRRNVPGNVNILQVAVGEETRSASICRTLKNTGAAFICDDDDVSGPFAPDDSTPVESVSMITIDSLDIRHLGLIKIDIQGSEAIALKGARETLRRCKPVLLIEEKPTVNKSFEEIEKVSKILTELGMKPQEKVGADRIYIF